MVMDMWRRFHNPETPKLNAVKHGFQFMEALNTQLVKAHDLSKNIYPLQSISQDEAGTVSRSFRPHRIWLNSNYINPAAELHFFAASREFATGDLLQTVYFQNALMKQAGHAYLLSLVTDSQKQSQAQYADIYIPPREEFTTLGIAQIHELKNGEREDCEKFMKKICASENIVDPPTNFEVYNTPMDVLRLSDIVGETLSAGKSHIHLNGLFY
jgi:hypothetical protein